MTSRDSVLAVDNLREMFSTDTVPDTLHADNEFRNSSLIDLCEEYGVKLIFSESYRPWGNFLSSTH